LIPEKSIEDTFKSQLTKLEEMKKGLESAKFFIDSQKQSLLKAQNQLTELKTEKEKLKPLVQADRELVDAILKIQAKRTHSNTWYERFIGFGFGIAASLIASFLHERFLRRPKNEVKPAVSFHRNENDKLDA
jgi:hypothetical protein